AAAVARAASGRAWGAQPALVDGAIGLVWAPAGRLRGAFCFAITEGKITAITMIADPKRIRELDIELLHDGPPADQGPSRR
ncbi:MAG TPA: hypothetical protein VFH30_05560, partial [Acidimicrobiales bacterium]|nr:hypothetical protein [Acidimicrobiales bacterium]